MEESGHHVIEIVGATVGLLLVAAGMMAISKRLKVPFTVALVVTGIALAQLAHFGGAVLEPIANLRIAPEIAFFVFLPTLIFESAFNLEARALRENLTAVLTLAVPGLLISTGLIAAIMVAATPFGWLEALLLG